MGQTPAKTFNPPQSFGGTPQANNVSQVQPLAQNQGPGFAAFGAFDQTGQGQGQAPQQSQGPVQSIFGGGSGVNMQNYMRANPFGMMMQ